MPTSPSPAEIACRSGALSHGPITAEGKARSSRNATRHDLCARTLVLGTCEDQAELDAVRAARLAARRSAPAACSTSRPTLGTPPR